MSDAQLRALLKPFSERLISPPADGKYGSYVSHWTIEQRILAVVGPYGWRIVQTVRDNQGAIVGRVGELTCVVDGREVVVAGSGDVENRHKVTSNGNPLVESDGAALKLAESDAFKRAAMRLGVGLHLWAGDDYFIYDALVKRAEQQGTDRAGENESILEGEDSGTGTAGGGVGTSPEHEDPARQG